MKQKIFVATPLPEKTIIELNQNFDCTFNDTSTLLEGLKAQGIHQYKGIVTLLSDTIDEYFFDANPSIDIVANYAVGYNNIDVQAATKNGVVVTNTPGVLTQTSADTAFALLMATARKITRGSRLARSGQWRGWEPTQLLGTDIYGAHIGIIGLGRIGKAMAKRAQGFDMKISYWNRTRLSKEEEEKTKLHYMPLDELLQTVDFISLHIAYNQDTHHLINAQRLDLIKPTAFIINTARGAVIDEQALIQCLEQNKIAGAGLDVFENEPFIPEALRELENTVILPHMGSASLKTREAMGDLVIQNLSAFFNGKKPINPVN